MILNIIKTHNMEFTCKVCGGAHTTGACTEGPKPASSAQQIEGAFKGIAGGVREAAFAKVAEYDARIRAARDGNPLKPGDTVDNLRADFKRFARQDWTENFDVDQYKKGAENVAGTTPESQESAGSTPETIDSERINEFILKLAEATNLGEADAVDSIVRQIQMLESDQNFSFILDSLDPDQYHSQTKLLSEAGRQRLRSALEQYIKKRSQQP